MEFDGKIGNLDILLNCPFFSVGVFNNKDRMQAGFELTQPMVLISLSCTGSVTNQDAADYTCHFKPGDTILMPKMAGILEITEPGQCLLTHLGTKTS